MSKEKLKQYNEIENKIFTTSEVIKKSFTNVISKLKDEEYVLIENQRQKITMVIQTTDQYVGVSLTHQSFGDNKVNSTKENKLLARTFIKENAYYLMKFESPNITFLVINNVYLAKNKNFFEILMKLSQSNL